MGVASLLAQASQLRVSHRDLDSVWFVELPRGPWAWRKAGEEVELVLHALVPPGSFAVAVLFGEGEAFRLNPDDPLETFAFRESRVEGAWAIAVFDDDVTADPARLSLPFFPKSDRTALTALRTAGARLVVWAFYDEREWLFAERDFASPPPTDTPSQ